MYYKLKCYHDHVMFSPGQSPSLSLSVSKCEGELRDEMNYFLFETITHTLSKLLGGPKPCQRKNAITMHHFCWEGILSWE